MPCTAFIGVISKTHGLLHYKLFEKSVNTVKYIKFLKEVIKRLNGAPFCIYQDNLMVHYSKKAKKFYEENDIDILYSAPYQPELNPIEFTFAVLK